MAAELFVRFEDPDWFSQNRSIIVGKIEELPTFNHVERNELWLKQKRKEVGGWLFDVRLFINDDHVFVEISARPQQIEQDLHSLFRFLRSKTSIFIVDDDGEDSNW